VTIHQALETAGRDYLVRVLSEAGGCVAKASVVAGVHRTTFYKLMEKYGVKVERQVKVGMA